MIRMPLHPRRFGFLLSAALLLVAVPSHGQEKQSSTKPLSLTTLKHYIQFATVLNCMPRDKTTNVYQGLRKSSKAFGVLFAESYGNRLENSKEKLSPAQAETVFANEVAIQLLNACPKSLSDSERSTIEAMRAELLKRRSAPPGRR
jgi:hypothetical protein